MFLLDTDVISEARKTKTPRIDKNVETWWAQAELTMYFLSVVTLMEIDEGVLRIERRDPVQGAVLRRWLEQFVLPSFEGRILSVTPPIARACAALRVPDKRQLPDALIAATARIHGLKILTRNVAHFEDTGVEIVNPWLRPR